jgi:hypothetical protein
VADYVEYGDTSGTIAGTTRAGDQPLPTVLIPRTDPAFLYGDADVLAGRAIGGDDRIAPASFTENNSHGDARLISENVQGGNDQIGASGSNNTLYGDAYEMTDRARGGDDSLQAGSATGARAAAENTLYGDAYAMGDRTQGGDDTLTGSDGFASPASLHGDAFEMTGRARGGDDRLVSGTNVDDMWGDAQFLSGDAEGGQDVFVFEPFNDRDVIWDFEQGEDRIDLSAFAPYGVTDFASIDGQVFEQSDGTLIVLDFGTVIGNSVVVVGAFGLGDGDFVFG